MERYFKYRYCGFNYPIGTLTEYFKFTNPDETQAVERDLFQMQAKVFLSVEQDIVNGKLDEFLAALLADEQMKTGNGQVRDRSIAELQQRFLYKPTSQQVITTLHQGASLREAASMAEVSVEVARKVLAVMQRE